MSTKGRNRVALLCAREKSGTDRMASEVAECLHALRYIALKWCQYPETNGQSATTSVSGCCQRLAEKVAGSVVGTMPTTSRGSGSCPSGGKRQSLGAASHPFFP